jgi:hypothetical protein
MFLAVAKVKLITFSLIEGARLPSSSGRFTTRYVGGPCVQNETGKSAAVDRSPTDLLFKFRTLYQLQLQLTNFMEQSPSWEFNWS